jgi:hypothetical protein
MSDHGGRKREYSRTLYHVPLLDAEGYVKLTKAKGVQIVAHIETGRTVRGNRGGPPDREKGTTRGHL